MKGFTSRVDVGVIVKLRNIVISWKNITFDVY